MGNGRRIRGVLFVMFVLTLSLVMVGRSIQVAEAFDPSPPEIFLPPSIGGAVTAGTPIAGFVLAGAAAFGASYYGTTRLLHFIFDGPSYDAFRSYVTCHADPNGSGGFMGRFSAPWRVAQPNGEHADLGYSASSNYGCRPDGHFAGIRTVGVEFGKSCYPTQPQGEIWCDYATTVYEKEITTVGNATAYPSCVSAMNGCILATEKNVGGTWTDCKTLNASCSGYSSSDTSTYRCSWGPYVLALSDCDELKPYYTDPTTTTKTEAEDNPCGGWTQTSIAAASGGKVCAVDTSTTAAFTITGTAPSNATRVVKLYGYCSSGVPYNQTFAISGTFTASVSQTCSTASTSPLMWTSPTIATSQAYTITVKTGNTAVVLRLDYYETLTTTTSAPQASPQPTPAPGANSTTTIPGGDPVDSSLPDGQDGWSCYPQGWAAFNPIEWVYKPVTCALRWAFVPTAADLETEVDGIKSSFDDTAIGTGVGAVADLVGGFTSFTDASGSAGCLGPAISLPTLHLIDWHPLSACEEPNATMATYSNTALRVVIYVGAIFGVVESLASAFGLVGVFNRQPEYLQLGFFD